MKRMKKILAAMLIATMAVSTCFVSFAAIAENNEGMSEVEFKKTFVATNSNATNSAETFKFTVERESFNNSGYNDLDSVPMVTWPDTNKDDEGKLTISFAKDEVTGEDATTDTNSVTLTIPDYKYVGVYTYKITENAGTTAGVNYDTTPMYLQVTVTNKLNANGELETNQAGEYILTRSAVLYYGNKTANNKTDNIKNSYDAGQLSITKDVTGNLGDTSKYFTVKVTLTGETGKTYNTGDMVISGGSASNNPTSVTMGQEMLFELRDGDTISITNIPYGVKYKVEEENYTGDNDGYEAAKYTLTDGSSVGQTTTTAISDAELDNDSEKVAIENSKQKDVDTGISLDSAPYLLLLAFAAMGVFAVAAKKREEEF